MSLVKPVSFACSFIKEWVCSQNTFGNGLPTKHSQVLADAVRHLPGKPLALCRLELLKKHREFSSPDPLSHTHMGAVAPLQLTLAMQGSSSASRNAYLNVSTVYLSSPG